MLMIVFRFETLIRAIYDSKDGSIQVPRLIGTFMT